MPDHVLLMILVILGFIVAACAVMAVIGWVLVAVLRVREAKRGPGEGSEQSVVVSNGVFELAGDDVVFEDDDTHSSDPVGVRRIGDSAGDAASPRRPVQSR